MTTKIKRKKAELKFFSVLLLESAFFLLFQVTSVEAKPELKVDHTSHCTVEEGGCKITLEASWPKGESDYLFSQPDLQLENLTIEDIGHSNENFQSRGQEWQRKTFSIELNPLKVGRGTIQTFKVVYVDPAKGEEGDFEVPRLQIEIRNKKSLGLSKIAALLTGVFSVSFVGFFSKKWRTQSKKLCNTKSLSTPASPEDRCLLTMKELERDLLSESKSRETFSKLNQVFRAYLSTNKENRTLEELKTVQKIFDRLNEFRFAEVSPKTEEKRFFYLEMIRFLEGKKPA